MKYVPNPNKPIKLYQPFIGVEPIDIGDRYNCPHEYLEACEKNRERTGSHLLPERWDLLRPSGPPVISFNHRFSPHHMHTVGTYILNKWDLPEGDPDSWDLEQETVAHTICEAFVGEFYHDMNAVAACRRLGCMGDDVGEKADTILNHPLTQQYLRQNVQNFCRTNAVTKDSVLALLWKHAHSSDEKISLDAVKKMLDLSGMSAQTEDSNAKPIRNITKADAMQLRQAFDKEY